MSLLEILKSCVVLAACAIAFTQAPASKLVAEPAAQGTNFNLEGKITEQTSGKLTVSTEENIIFHVRYDDKTDIKRDDNAEASSKDLRVGVRIKVEGDLTESGDINASRIIIEKSGGKEKSDIGGSRTRSLCQTRRDSPPLTLPRIEASSRALLQGLGGR